MVGSCCADEKDGVLRKRVPSLQPPGVPTNFSHPKCYLRDTQNCSEQASGEHVVSATILRQLGDSILVSGMPWLAPGQTMSLTVNNLTANILCKRHNETLSPLDTEAGRFFSTLETALIDFRAKKISRRPFYDLFSGSTLELWMLKVATGAFFALGSDKGRKLSDTHTIDLAKVRKAFFESTWDDRGGLYFAGDTGSITTIGAGVSVSLFTAEQSKTFAGIRIYLLGFEFDLYLDTTGANPAPWTGLTHRPYEIFFHEKDRKHSIFLSWPLGTPLKQVSFDMNDGS
jgi:hypothetical protein